MGSVKPKQVKIKIQIGEHSHTKPDLMKDLVNNPNRFDLKKRPSIIHQGAIHVTRIIGKEAIKAANFD